jgi:tetratricopeptide (TPR) repeat protein
MGLHRAFAVALLWLAVAVTATAQTSSGQTTPSALSLSEEGTAHAKERRYDQAILAFQRAIAIDPKFAHAHYGLGTTYLNLGRPAEALEPLRTAVGLDPSLLGAQMNLGIALASMRRHDESMIHFDAARRLRPDDPSVHDSIGFALHNNGRVEEALASYREARRLAPTVAGSIFSEGLMLMRLARFDEAIEPLETAARLDPTYDNARYHLSNAYNRVGRFADAVLSFTTLLVLRPDLPEGLQHRAWNALYAGGRGAMVAADATRFLERVEWKHATAPFMAVLASIGFRQSGDVEAAEAILDEALRRGKAEVWPSPVIRYLRGQQTAEQLLADADTNDRRTEARAYLGLDLILRGRIDEARGHFEWVREFGNRRFLEYTLAVAELNRLGIRK